MDEVCVASKLGKEIQIYEANLIVLVLRVCDEPVETGKHICVEPGGQRHSAVEKAQGWGSGTVQLSQWGAAWGALGGEKGIQCFSAFRISIVD